MDEAIDGAKTQEACAQRILDLFVTHNRAAGEFLSGKSLALPFSADGWEPADFERGRRHAADRGWIRIVDDECLGLTAEGQARARA